jgi:hypothetical protein
MDRIETHPRPEKTGTHDQVMNSVELLKDAGTARRPETKDLRTLGLPALDLVSENSAAAGKDIIVIGNNNTINGNDNSTTINQESSPKK